MALFVLLSCERALADEPHVIINLSEQTAYLIEQGRVVLVSPIASGREGWRTPVGRFTVFSKDAGHRSASFGRIVDGRGNTVNSNATPGSHCPPGCSYKPAPMPYFMEFANCVGMHAGYLPGYPASHGCVRMPRDMAALFYARVRVGTPVQVVGNPAKLSRVRKAIPLAKALACR